MCSYATYVVISHFSRLIRVGLGNFFLRYQSTSLGIVCGLVQLGNVQNLRSLASKMANRMMASEVYVVSHTNKTGDFEAIFEISYFQLTQKPLYTICYSYGPTNLRGKVWGHAASICPSYRGSNFSFVILQTNKIWGLVDRLNGGCLTSNFA